MKPPITRALIFLALFSLPGFAQSATVRTDDGAVAGVALSNGLEVFKGIPFAAPPVGKLRWQPPQPAPSWKGVRKADHFGSPCMQPPSPDRLGPWTKEFLSELPPSEDCLYLNIWTTAKHPATPLPVMVWIYGGGFTSGASNVAVYDGAALARKGVVLVSFNYRVGPFGFLASPELTQESPHHSSGNYALLDQIAALRWVQRNISAFGGDPRQVTIFGQSAGAASVWLLMQSPLAGGLFQRAIIMSGPGALPFSPLQDAQAAQKSGQQFATMLGAHSLAQLRSLPAEKIVQASQRVPFGAWVPNRDGWVLGDNHPHPEVPVISGMVADDIGIGYYGNGPAPPVTMESYRHRMQGICGSEIAECEKLYPAQNDQQAAAAITAALQDRARVSLYRWAEQQMRQSPHIYLYYFDREIPWPQHPEYKVFHSSELPYVFDNLRFLDRPWQPVDRRVADQISSYWTNFGKTGNPTNDDLADWPPFKSGTFTIMQLGVQMGPMPLASPARRQLWMKLLKAPLGF